ncbi:hypothetical protein LCGC14_1307880, partial [marine sediment metagenome]
WMHFGLWVKDNSSHQSLCLGWNSLNPASDGEGARDYREKFSFHTNEDATPSAKSQGLTTIQETAFDGAKLIVNEFFWLKIILYTDGSVAAFADFSNSETDPPTYDNALGFSQSGVSFGNTIKIGVSWFSSNVGTGSMLEFDNLSIKSAAVIDPTGIDGSIEFNSFYLKNAANVLGSGTIVCPSPYLVITSATYQAQLKKELVYTDVYGNVSWQGEMLNATINNLGTAYELEEMSMKTKYTNVGASPIALSHIIKDMDGLTIIDKFANFVSAGVINTQIVTFEKNNLKVYATRPDRTDSRVTESNGVTIYTGGAGTLDTGSDNLNNLYFYDDQDAADNDQATWYEMDLGGPGDAENYQVHLYNYGFRKFANTMNKITINITLAYHSTVGWGSGDADLIIYNDYRGTFDVFEAFSTGNVGNGFIVSDAIDSRRSDRLSFTWDIESKLKTLSTIAEYNVLTAYVQYDRIIFENKVYTAKQNTTGDTPGYNTVFWKLSITDYFGEIVTAGDSSQFNKDRLIIIIKVPLITGDTHGGALLVYETLVTYQYEEENLSELSTAQITTVAQGIITTTINGSVSLPAEDGFGVGDTAYFVKSVEDYLQDQYDASDLNSNLGALLISVTNGSTTAFTTDYTYKSFFELLQAISSLLNATWWISYSVPITLLLKSADNHIVSGVHITRADMVDFNLGKWSFTVDAAYERSSIIVLGKTTNAIATSTPSPEHAAAGGPETETIFDNSAATQAQAQTKANSKLTTHTNARRFLSFDVDPTNPSNSYSNMEVGKSVTTDIQTYDGTVITNDTFMVLIKELNKNPETGDIERITFLLQKRDA